MKRFRPLRVIIAVIAALMLTAGIYAAYVFLSYKRIPDGQKLDVSGSSTAGNIKTGEKYKIVSDNVDVSANTNLNIGFRYSDHNPVTMEFTLLPG